MCKQTVEARGKQSNTPRESPSILQENPLEHLRGIWHESREQTHRLNCDP